MVLTQSEGDSSSTFSSHHYTFDREADPLCSVSGDSPHEVGLFCSNCPYDKSNETLGSTYRSFSACCAITVHHCTQTGTCLFHHQFCFCSNPPCAGNLFTRLDFSQGSSRCASIKFLSIEPLFSGSPQIIFNGGRECSKASTSQHPSLHTSYKTDEE